MKVYCERGAYSPKLRDLEKNGLITLIHFPYEGHNRNIKQQAIPSVVTVDCTYITADSEIPISQCSESSKMESIRAIVGAQSEFDARHLDSVYKSECGCFLTPDKKDIADRAAPLEALLGFKVFHPPTQWEEFVAFVEGHAKQ